METSTYPARLDGGLDPATSRWLWRPVPSGAVAALVGVFATAVGAGIGVRHLTKTGLTAGSVLGLALLVLGLALLAFAGVVAWRALHRWQRLWLLPIALSRSW